MSSSLIEPSIGDFGLIDTVEGTPRHSISERFT
jgi:hypothetical protein